MNINCVVLLIGNVDKFISFYLSIKKGDWNSIYFGEFL